MCLNLSGPSSVPPYHLQNVTFLKLGNKCSLVNIGSCCIIRTLRRQPKRPPPPLSPAGAASATRRGIHRRRRSPARTRSLEKKKWQILSENVGKCLSTLSYPVGVHVVRGVGDFPARENSIFKREITSNTIIKVLLNIHLFSMSLEITALTSCTLVTLAKWPSKRQNCRRKKHQ